MPMTEAQARSILESDEVQKSRSGNPTGHRFITGYELLLRGCVIGTTEQIHPTNYGVIYTFTLDQLPHLEEITLKEVGRQGFYLDLHSKRFAYNVLEPHGRRRD